MDILLLHGALGSAAQFSALSAEMQGFCKPHTINFYGHGGSKSPSGSFQIRSFAKQVIDWMDERSIRTMDFVGYSMGGYVALYIARYFPDRAGKIMTLSTKFLWTPEIAAREAKNLEPDVIEKKAPEFGKRLQDLHGAGWKDLIKRTGDMIISIAADNPLKSADYRAIKTRVMVTVGDSDKLVSLEETTDVYRQLENASFLVLPATGHPLEAYDTRVVSFHARKFFEGAQ